jgi:hypothetical protein
MRLHQQRRNKSGVKVKKEKSNAVNIKNPDYSAWCFKNTGKKWNNHREATCHNKKKHRGRRKRRRRKKSRICYACQSTKHIAKDRPLLATVRTMMVSENPNVPENKATATLPPANYPKVSPNTGFSDHRTPCLRCHVHVRRHVNVGHAHARPL